MPSLSLRIESTNTDSTPNYIPPMFNQQVSLGTDDLAWDRTAWESQPYGPPEDGSHLSDIGTWPLLKSTVVPRWVGDRPRVADLADDSI